MQLNPHTMCKPLRTAKLSSCGFLCLLFLLSASTRREFLKRENLKSDAITDFTTAARPGGYFHSLKCILARNLHNNLSLLAFGKKRRKKNCYCCGARAAISNCNFPVIAWIHLYLYSNNESMSTHNKASSGKVHETFFSFQIPPIQRESNFHPLLVIYLRKLIASNSRLTPRPGTTGKFDVPCSFLNWGEGSRLSDIA